MIFVTIGTHNQQFNRLLIEVDRLVEMGKIKNVIAQIGHSDYVPKHYKWFKFLDFDKMLELQKESDLIISHGGVGSITTALFLNKKIIVVPRLKKYNEHVDEHQFFTTKKLEEQGRIIAVYEVKDLGKALGRAKNFKPRKSSSKSRILEIVSNYLSSLS